MIASIDAAPVAGLRFDARLVALSADGIDGGKRYWLKSSSRRQRVKVSPLSSLDLHTGRWDPSDRLELNAIGSVQLAFDETAIFDPYEANRNTGAFILIDPDTNNTVAGGMITGRSESVGGIDAGEGRDHVVLSLPADLADRLMASEAFAELREHADVRWASGRKAAAIMQVLD